jgi:hypothetical protein
VAVAWIAATTSPSLPTSRRYGESMAEIVARATFRAQKYY